MVKITMVGRASGVRKEVKILNPYVRFYVMSFDLAVDQPASIGGRVRVAIEGPTGPRVPGNLNGEIAEGDVVEVSGKWEPGKILVVKEALNRTRNNKVGH